MAVYEFPGPRAKPKGTPDVSDDSSIQQTGVSDQSSSQTSDLVGELFNLTEERSKRRDPPPEDFENYVFEDHLDASPNLRPVVDISTLPPPLEDCNITLIKPSSALSLVNDQSTISVSLALCALEDFPARLLPDIPEDIDYPGTVTFHYQIRVTNSPDPIGYLGIQFGYDCERAVVLSPILIWDELDTFSFRPEELQLEINERLEDYLDEHCLDGEILIRFSSAGPWKILQDPLLSDAQLIKEIKRPDGIKFPIPSDVPGFPDCCKFKVRLHEDGQRVAVRPPKYYEENSVALWTEPHDLYLQQSTTPAVSVDFWIRVPIAGHWDVGYNGKCHDRDPNRVVLDYLITSFIEQLAEHNQVQALVISGRFDSDDQWSDFEAS